MRKLIKTLLKVILIIAIFTFAYIGINEGMAAYVHYQASQTCIATSEDYIYVTNQNDAEKAVEAVQNIFEHFPAGYIKEFKSDWIFIFSSTPPDALTEVSPIDISAASGLTLQIYKTIWIDSDRSDSYDILLSHELGHFLAFELGGRDYSKTFLKLYNDNKDGYSSSNPVIVSEYSTGTPMEFFAFLCEEYVCYPGHLSAEFPDGYKYIQACFGENPYTSFLSVYKNEFISSCYTIKEQIKGNVTYLKTLLEDENTFRMVKRP